MLLLKYEIPSSFENIKLVYTEKNTGQIQCQEKEKQDALLILTFIYQIVLQEISNTSQNNFFSLLTQTNAILLFASLSIPALCACPLKTWWSCNNHDFIHDLISIGKMMEQLRGIYFDQVNYFDVIC